MSEADRVHSGEGRRPAKWSGWWKQGHERSQAGLRPKDKNKMERARQQWCRRDPEGMCTNPGRPSSYYTLQPQRCHPQGKTGSLLLQVILCIQCIRTLQSGLSADANGVKILSKTNSATNT